MELFLKILIAAVVIGGTLYGIIDSDGKKKGPSNCYGTGYTSYCD